MQKNLKGEIPSTSRMVYYVLQGCWKMQKCLKGEIPSTSRVVCYIFLDVLKDEK